MQGQAKAPSIIPGLMRLGPKYDKFKFRLADIVSPKPRGGAKEKEGKEV